MTVDSARWSSEGVREWVAEGDRPFSYMPPSVPSVP
jgi:hypothetical protein